MPAEGHGGGSCGRGGRRVPGGSHGCAVREEGRAAAGRGKRAGGTGEEGAASGLAGDSGGGDGKAEGSGLCGRTGRDAWGLVYLSPTELCGAGWQGEGCGR